MAKIYIFFREQWIVESERGIGEGDGGWDEHNEIYFIKMMSSELVDIKDTRRQRQR